jgi:NADP-dependent 3-hydroxy acid dehydrogenase YdfG
MATTRFSEKRSGRVSFAPSMEAKLTALITGASSGIGRATAMKLAANGYRLILCGRRTNRLETLRQELEKITDVCVLLFDVRDDVEVQQALESLKPPFDAIDVLLNSAGNAHGLSSFAEGDIADWDAMIDSNVKGLLYVSRRVVPGMIARAKGHVVNLSSVAGKFTYANGAVYCASKQAVESISQGMRLDLTQHGIKVTNIAPGAVETEFSLVRFKWDAERAAKVYEGFEPIRPEDVADAIWYALSAPDHVTVGDIVLYAKAQAAPTVIYRKVI